MYSIYPSQPKQIAALTDAELAAEIVMRTIVVLSYNVNLSMPLNNKPPLRLQTRAGFNRLIQAAHERNHPLLSPLVRKPFGRDYKQAVKQEMKKTKAQLLRMNRLLIEFHRACAKSDFADFFGKPFGDDSINSLNCRVIAFRPEVVSRPIEKRDTALAS